MNKFSTDAYQQFLIDAADEVAFHWQCLTGDILEHTQLKALEDAIDGVLGCKGGNINEGG